MNDVTKVSLASLLIVAVVVGGLAWAYWQWNECRGMGFSVLYCLQHVM